jgi:hypothetical protein
VRRCWCRSIEARQHSNAWRHVSIRIAARASKQIPSWRPAGRRKIDGTPWPIAISIGTATPLRRPVPGEVYRISVGPGASDPAGTDVSVRSADIFDNDGLSKRFSHPISENTRKYIRRPARGRRHDHGDGARRIGLRTCHGRRPAAVK